MAKSEIEQLVISLTADNARLNKQLQKATADTRNALGQIERQAKVSMDRVNAALGTFGVGLSLAAVGNFVKSAVTQLDAIGDSAKNLGVTTDFLQAFNYEARLAGAEANDAESGLRKFSDAIGQAGIKETELTKFFEQNNIALKNKDGSLRDTSAVLKDYAVLIASASTQQEKIALATDAFGKSGYRLISVLEQIAYDGYEPFIEKAKQAGVVVEEGMINSADAIERKWTQLYEKLTLSAKSFAVNVAGFLSQAFSETNNAVTDESIKVLQQKEKYFSDIVSKGKLSDLDRLQGTTDLSKVKSDLESVRGQLRLIEDQKSKLNLSGDIKNSNTINKKQAPSILGDFSIDYFDKSTKGIGGGSSSTTNAYQQAIESIYKKIEAERIEAQTIGLSEEASARLKTQMELEAAAREATGTITAKQAEEIAKLSDAYALQIAAQEAAREKQEQLKLAQQEAIDLQRFAGQSISGFFSDIISGGENAEKALSNLIKKLADAALQAALLGDGPLAGLFGGSRSTSSGLGGVIGAIFGGLSGSSKVGAPLNLLPRADGGQVKAGTSYMVGERGREVFRPNVNGTIIPNKNLGGGGTSVVINADFRGADPSMKAYIDGKLSQLSSTIEGRAINAVAIAKRNRLAPL